MTRSILSLYSHDIGVNSHPLGFVFDDIPLGNETDLDPCPDYASLGAVTGEGVNGPSRQEDQPQALPHQEELSEALVGLDEALAGLDSLLNHLGAGTIEGIPDLLSVPNKGVFPSADEFLPTYSDTRVPSFIHLSTTSTSSSTGATPPDASSSTVVTTIPASTSNASSDPDLDREVSDLTTPVTPDTPAETPSIGLSLGARPRDSNPLFRSNAFRSPADNMDVHLRTHRVVRPITHDSGFATSGHDCDSHQTGTDHAPCLVPAPRLQRSPGCLHLPTLIVSPMPRPAPRFSRSLVAVAEAAGADPSLMIRATVGSSQDGPSPASHQPPTNTLPVSTVGLQFPMNGTEGDGAGETQGGEEASGDAEIQGAAGGIEIPNGLSGAPGSAPVWTPTTAVGGVTFGAVSDDGCKKLCNISPITFPLISIHSSIHQYLSYQYCYLTTSGYIIFCYVKSSYVLGCEICLLPLRGFRCITCVI